MTVSLVALCCFIAFEMINYRVTPSKIKLGLIHVFSTEKENLS